MKPNYRTELLGSVELGQYFDCVRKRLRKVLVPKPLLLRRLYRLRMLGYEWLLELGSFLRCSRVLLLHGEVPFLGLGPAYGLHRETGLLAECTRTRGRIACMREMRQQGPSLSTGDMRLILKGFDLGSEWTQNNPHFCIPRTGPHRKPQDSCEGDLSR